MDRNEAIKVIKDNWSESRHQLNEALITLIPELNEHEDEKIIDALKLAVVSYGSTNHNYISTISKGQLIAWLEKQGRQKPSDEFKPKFKVGDWCIDDEDGTIFQIVKVLDNTYKYKTNEGYEYSCTHYTLENDAKLWTIQDAKNGDVLADDYSIIIFRKIGNDFWKDVIDFYVGYNHDSGKFLIQSGKSHYGTTYGSSFNPATKEQRDLLFSKMKESGYEWDVEKKELKMIEQKPEFC